MYKLKPTLNTNFGGEKGHLNFYEFFYSPTKQRLIRNE